MDERAVLVLGASGFLGAHLVHAFHESGARVVAAARRPEAIPLEPRVQVERRVWDALEPDATKFMETMRAFKTWGESLSATCRARVVEIGEKLPIGAELDKRTPAVEAKVKPILEKCENHPGFKDAAARGLRVLRKKRAP